MTDTGRPPPGMSPENSATGSTRSIARSGPGEKSWNSALTEASSMKPPASVVSHKYGYEDARAFWSSARRDDL